MMRSISLTALAPTILVLFGCTDAPKPAQAASQVKKAPEIPTGPIPAFTAYYKMYAAARLWSPDVQTASLTAIDPENAGGQDGKYPAWSAVFVSPSKRQSHHYSYATVEQGRITKGISSTGVMPWAGSTREAAAFSNSDFKIDSDAAYTAAAEKAADWVKKNPTKPITTFALGDATRFPAPTWYIVWGNKTGGYAVYVNAFTGQVLGK